MVGIGDIVAHQMPHSEDLTRKKIFFCQITHSGAMLFVKFPCQMWSDAP